MLTILCISFVLFMVLGVPIAICLGASAALAIFWASPVPLLVVAQKLFQGMNNFSYLAIPLFLLAGNIMAETKISERLVALAYVMFGKYPGGMSNVATASSAFFSTISGSAPATTAAVGSVLIPSMTQRNYPPASSAAVVAASGALGLILPPSLTMVIYGVISGVSIGDIFMNGIVPGLILVAALLLTNYLLAKRRGLVADKTIVAEKFWDVLRRSIFALLMPVIIFAGIYSGAFTATESAAVACVYGLFVGFFIYRTLTLTGLINAFKATIANTTVVLFLMACANAFAYIITSERVPQMAAGMLVGLTDSPLLIMFLLLGFLLLVGMFLDNVSALVLLVPTLMSIIAAYGIDPMYFGIFAIIALAVGQFTPPVGLNVFIAARIAKQPVEPVFAALVPYVLVYVLVLVLFIFFPSLLVMYKS